MSGRLAGRRRSAGGGVWIAALAALAATILVFSSCGMKPAAPAQMAGADSQASLKMDPDPPATMRATWLELMVRDAGGRPVTGAAVQLDLTMPAMKMPPNQPQVEEVGGGVYRALALFTMAGDWQIAADVRLPQGMKRFTFDVSIH